MREIKFRVWYKDKMWLPEGIQSYSDFMVSALGGVFFMNEPGYYNGKDHSAVLMQYTGLKDKNGREIYEGDVVVEEIETGKYKPFVVKWHNDYACFDMSSSPCWTILGNIYENPGINFKHATFR